MDARDRPAECVTTVSACVSRATRLYLAYDERYAAARTSWTIAPATTIRNPSA
jgi:hypothetical protein